MLSCIMDKLPCLIYLIKSKISELLQRISNNIVIRRCIYKPISGANAIPQDVSLHPPHLQWLSDPGRPHPLLCHTK